MYGQDLTKLITESCVQSSLRKSTLSMSQYGDLEPEEDVRERYKDRPLFWANIQRNAYKTCHPVSGEPYLWMPKLHLDMSQIEEHSEVRKRAIEAEYKAKPKKLPRTSKRN
eukprot:12231505-Karenia_brevis.AAC.1